MNQILHATINKYFTNTTVENIVKTHIFTILENFSLEHIKCLQIDDNTLNGIDTKKNSWRAHFVNLQTEEDFYIEVSVNSSGIFKSCCYTIDNNDNVKIIYPSQFGRSKKYV